MKKNSNSFIKVIKTRKYKDICLYLRFSMPATYKNRAASLLLSKMIVDSCECYPGKKEFTKVKDMLYGISIDSRSEYRAGLLTQCIDYSFIHPKFVSVKLDDYVAFIHNTLYHCSINDKELKEAKEIVCSKIYRRLEKPSALAVEKMIETISKDNADFGFNGLSERIVKEIAKLTVKDVQEYYDYILSKAQLYVYVSGDVNDKIVKQLTDFDFKNRDVFKRKHYAKDNKARKDVTVKLKVSQSTLISVYKTPYDKYSKEFFAWKLGNIFLGALPCSLLFEEVREKMSLCYTISVLDYLNEGYVRVATNIDAKKKKIVLQQIQKQIDRLVNEDYDVRKLDMAKKLFCGSLDSIYDSDTDLIDYYYEGALSNSFIPLNEYKKKINAVTPKDISKVFKNYTHYFTLLVEGVDHE